MTVNITTPRYTVQYRRPGERKWVTLATLASLEVATQAMFDLMGGRSGDWRVTQVAGAASPGAEGPGQNGVGNRSGC